jgi:transcriptional regulator with XRE-family HTH domain
VHHKKMGSAFSAPAVVTKRLALLGRLIQAAREERGLTQSELAERTGTSRATIHRLEAGHASVAWGTVMTTCWILGLPTDPDALPAERRGELLAKGEMIHRVRSQHDFDDDF